MAKRMRQLDQESLRMAQVMSSNQSRVALGEGSGFGSTDQQYYNNALLLGTSGGIMSSWMNASRLSRIYLLRLLSYDPYVNRAVQIHTDLPMARMRLDPPKSEDYDKSQQIMFLTERMCDRIELFKNLIPAIREHYRTGDSYIYFVWDDAERQWTQMYLLPPEYCHTKKSLVLMGDGSWKNIDKVCIGDLVVTHEGNVQSVASISQRKVDEDIYTLKVSGFSAKAEVTGEHPYWIHRKGRKADNWEWIPVNQIKEGDSVKYSVPTEITSNSYSDDHAELLGFFVGDGCVSTTPYGRKVVKLFFGSHERKYALRIQKILEKCFPPENGVYKAKNKKLVSHLHEIKEDHVLSIVYTNQSVAQFFKEAGLGAKNKRVPEWVLYAKDSQIQAFLKGYGEADGHVNKRGDWVANSASPNLIQQLRWLWTRLGAWCNDQTSITAHGASWEDGLDRMHYSTRLDQVAFRITVSEPYVCLINGIQPTRRIHRSGRGWSIHRVRCVDVTKREVEVFHLGVPGDDSYIVDGAAVHNCLSFLRESDNDEVIIYAHPSLHYEFGQLNLYSEYELNDTDLRAHGISLTELDEYDSPDFDLPEEFDGTSTHVLNTDPYKGSFVFHLARERTTYEEYGHSLLEPLVEPLLREAQYRKLQSEVVTQNRTPFLLVTTEETVSPDQLDTLRTEIDLSLLNPEYPIVVNYPVDAQWISNTDKYLTFDSELDRLTEEKFAGLGLPRDMITGESLYGGFRLNLEVLNIQYLRLREEIQYMVNEKLFKPFSRRNNFIEDVYLPELGNRKISVVLHCELAFNRLPIRDPTEIFEQLMTLYQKGTIPVDFILDLLNIDTEEATEKVKQSLWTAKDNMFNEFVSRVYDDAAATVVDKTDVVTKLVHNSGLNLAESPLTEDEEDGNFFGSRLSSLSVVPGSINPAKWHRLEAAQNVMEQEYRSKRTGRTFKFTELPKRSQRRILKKALNGNLSNA